MRRRAWGAWGLAGVGLAGVGLAGPAWAHDFRAWQGLHAGMLMEAVDGDLRAAAGWYGALLGSVPEEDASRGALAFWLGRAWYLLGDPTAARQSLQLAVLDPRSEARTLALLGQIDAQEHQVTELPLELDFDEGPLPWLHSWEFSPEGRLYAEALPDGAGGALVWETVVASREEDQIQVWFAPGADQPEEVTMLLRASTFPTLLVVLVMDEQERWYGGPDFVRVPVDGWVELALRSEDLAPLAGEPVVGAGGPPRQVRTLALRDVTAVYSSDRGPNTILIDRVRVR